MSAFETLDNDTLKKLASFEAPLCLTLTMPCITKGNQQTQNPIRFKNLLQASRAKLEKLGWDQRVIEEFLSPFLQHIDNEEMWKHTQNGLIACAAKDFHIMRGLPFEIQEDAIIDRHFYLRPIIPHMQQTTQNALFLLAMNEPRLIIGTGAQDHETLIPQAPYHSYDAFMEIYDEDKSERFTKPGYGAGLNSAPSGIHSEGVYGDGDTKKRHLEEYLKQVENWVNETLIHRNLKEVYLVAEPHLQGLYNNVARASHPKIILLAQSNPQSQNEAQWLSEMKSMKEKDFSRQNAQILEDFKRFEQTQEKSVKENIDEIIKEAFAQNIDTLAIADNQNDRHWGHYNAENMSVERHPADNNGVDNIGDELINLAVIKTYLNGGTVLPLPENAQPRYAAICRW